MSCVACILTLVFQDYCTESQCTLTHKSEQAYRACLVDGPSAGISKLHRMARVQSGFLVLLGMLVRGVILPRLILVLLTRVSMIPLTRNQSMNWDNL